MFNFIRNCQTGFQRDCTILHSHQQSMRVPVALHPHQHLVFSVCFLFCPFIKVCNCNFTLMANDVEHLLVCLLAILTSSWMTFLLKPFAQLLVGLFVCFLLSFESSSYTWDTNLLLDMWFANILSKFVACLFILLKVPFS